MNKPPALPVRAKQNRTPSTKPKASSQNEGNKTPTSDVTLETIGDEIHLSFGGQRRYRVRGLEQNHGSQQLKVNILAVRPDANPGGSHGGDLLHLDTLDLYKARSRNSFIKATASELFTDQDVIKRDIGTMLLKLEQLQHEQIEAATRIQQPVEPTPEEKRAALKLLTRSEA